MEMTLPAIVVSVIRAAATGLPASGPKVIQRVLPAGQEGNAADRDSLRNDGRITRWAPPDDVAVQSQAEGRAGC